MSFIENPGMSVVNGSSPTEAAPSNCSEGILLPLKFEESWPVELRTILYLLALLYFFLGAATVNEYVMESTAIITSTTKKIYLSKTPQTEKAKDDGPEVLELRVWHDTVVNLTLMAFSTSAEEILLCVVELIGKNFDHGELGPGTIVGSAAFNTLVVTAICMVSVPDNGTRKIEGLQVYFVSIFFALVTYAWLLVILRLISPDVVTLSESLVTVVMFPIFIFLVWLSHHNFWNYCAIKVLRRSKPAIPHHKSVDERKEIDEDLMKDGELDRENLARLVHKLKRHSGLTDHDAATIAAAKLSQNQPHSILWYRIGGIRALTAGYRHMPELDARLRKVYKEICETETICEHYDGASTIRSGKRSTMGSGVMSTEGSTLRSSTYATSLHDPHVSVIEFHSAIVAVERTVGNTEVTVSRFGNLDVHARVRLTSLDGTAKKYRDYIPIDKILVFEPGQREHNELVVIKNLGGWNEDEEFFLRLCLIHNDHEHVELGRIHIMAVTIIDGHKQSLITFEKRAKIIKESADMVNLQVNRHEGASGLVVVHWRTLDRTALAGKDYLGGTGELVFNPGEMSLHIEIPIFNHMELEKDVYFEIELYGPTAGAKLGRINRCTVTITSDDDLLSFVSTLASMTAMNLDSIRVKKSTWAQQMKNALQVDGGATGRAKPLDYIAHFFCFFWKALFSLIPPPTTLGGWPCFLVSLTTLGFITALISDVASVFGCLVNVDDTVTAISLVALGSSLSDVLSGRQATKMESTADACMIGTAGRIAVNVMVGLGLPWLIAVIYNYARGTEFRVKDRNLGIIVGLFILFALVAQIILVVRRLSPILGNAEIGGPPVSKWVTFAVFMLLWISYMMSAHYLMHGHVNPIE